MSIAFFSRLGFICLLCTVACGCQDGPMYALKYCNPYFTMREWKEDRALGVTDHERRSQLEELAGQIDSMSEEDQAFWAQHLERILKEDPSPAMRRWAVIAASRTKVPNALDVVERGLDDDSIKVRMATCQALGERDEPRAAQLLASTVGTSTEQDVKNSAIAALGKHKGQIPVDSLRIVLEEQDPATVDLAMSSLRTVTDKDYGNNPSEWIAALDAAAPATPGGTESGDVRFASGEEPLIR